MAATIYLGYMLALLVVPLLVKWRWGLATSVVVSAAELVLVVPLVYGLLVPAGLDMGTGPTPESLEAKIRLSQARGYLYLIFFVMFPGIAALTGGCLAVVWWAIVTTWRR